MLGLVAVFVVLKPWLVGFVAEGDIDADVNSRRPTRRRNSITTQIWLQMRTPMRMQTPITPRIRAGHGHGGLSYFGVGAFRSWCRGHLSSSSPGSPASFSIGRVCRFAGRSGLGLSGGDGLLAGRGPRLTRLFSRILTDIFDVADPCHREA